jgi:nitrous oxidase accessory protein
MTPLASWLPRIILAAVLSLGLAGAARGQETQSAAMPVCPDCAVTSLAEAVATAAPGATIEVRGGTYPGNLVIDQPLRLIGVDQPVIDGGGEGSLLTIRGVDAEVSGFVLRATGENLDREDAAILVEGGAATLVGNRIEDALFGIYLKQAPGSIVRDNVILSKDLPLPRRGDGIKTWYSDGVIIENNQASDGRDIILWYSNDGIVRNNEFDRERYGLHLMYSDRALVEGNSLSENSIGLYIMYSRNPLVIGNSIVNNHGPSGGGVGLKDVDGAVIEGNRFVNNQIAIQVDTSPREPGIENYTRGNVFAYNHVAIAFQPSVRHNTVTGNTFIDNTEHVAILGRGQLQDITWATDGLGNYWSDYAGYDADGDGVGDLPYQSRRLFESLMDQYPLLRFFVWTPAASAVDFAARAMPSVRPEIKLADPSPLMAPVAHPALPAVSPPSRAGQITMGFSGLALAGAAVVAYVALRRSPPRLPARRFPRLKAAEAA